MTKFEIIYGGKLGPMGYLPFHKKHSLKISYSSSHLSILPEWYRAEWCESQWWPWWWDCGSESGAGSTKYIQMQILCNMYCNIDSPWVWLQPIYLAYPYLSSWGGCILTCHSYSLIPEASWRRWGLNNPIGWPQTLRMLQTAQQELLALESYLEPHGAGEVWKILQDDLGLGRCCRLTSQSYSLLSLTWSLMVQVRSE